MVLNQELSSCSYCAVVIVVIVLILFIIDIGRENSFRSPAIDRANNAI